MSQRSKPVDSLVRAINLIGTVALLVGVGLGVFFVASGGSRVDESGLLVEEFWALGLSWFFVLGSVFMAALGLVIRLFARKRN